MSESTTVQLIAPSGWPDAGAVARGVARLRRLGCEVAGEERAVRRYLRFSGTDGERAADINQLADPEWPLPDIVMAVRGGYGVHRLLPHLDYEGLRERLVDQSCVLVGHSDITALSLALLARAGLVTFAGPMLAYDFGGHTTSAFTLREFWRTLRTSAHVVRWQTHPTVAFRVIGTLWGGNLAMLCSLIGTPYLPRIEHGILFLEDVSEPVYRIERLFYQLKLSGVLDRQQVIVLGDFSGFRSDDYDPAYDMATLVEHVQHMTEVPVVTHLPFGHCIDKVTLPIGARAQLGVSADGHVELAFTSYPHLAIGAPGQPVDTAKMHGSPEEQPAP